MKYVYLHLLLALFVMSGCQMMPVQAPSPRLAPPMTPTHINTKDNVKVLVSEEAICGIIYQNGFKFGASKLEEVEHWLKRKGIDYVILESPKKSEMKYIKLSSSVTSTDLVFYDDVLLGADIRALPQGAYSFGQAVSVLGPPEYFYAGVAHNATPVGACEKECYYSVRLFYPSKGVEISTIAGSTESNIIIDENMKIKTITCYAPGNREVYEKSLYGIVFPLPPKAEWSGFGFVVRLRE